MLRGCLPDALEYKLLFLKGCLPAPPAPVTGEKPGLAVSFGDELIYRRSKWAVVNLLVDMMVPMSTRAAESQIECPSRPKEGESVY